MFNPPPPPPFPAGPGRRAHAYNISLSQRTPCDLQCCVEGVQHPKYETAYNPPHVPSHVAISKFCCVNCTSTLPAGFAVPAVVSFVISLGRKASNGAALAEQLHSQGDLPKSSQLQKFASALIARIPRAGVAPSAYKQQEREAIAAQRQNRQVRRLLTEPKSDTPYVYLLHLSQLAPENEVLISNSRGCTG